MADGPAPKSIEPNDWQAVEPNDWQLVGSVPAPKEGFLGEMGKQNVALGKGVVSVLPGHAKEPLSSLAHGAYETVAAPVRELAGRPQPGRSAMTASPGLLRNPTDALTGALSALVGGDPAAARAHLLSGDSGAANADLFGIPAETALVGGLLRRFLPAKVPANEKAANLLTKASGATEGRAIDFPKEFSVALPELNKTAPKVPFAQMTVADLSGHVQDTFGRLENDFNNKLAPIANQPANPTPIIDELRSYKVITPITAEDVAWNHAVDSRMTEFSRPVTYADLNIQRMKARDRIADFGKKFPSAQGSKMGSDVGIAMDTAINDGSREIIYDSLQQHYRGLVPDNFFRDLKRTESALYNIKDQLSGRTKQLANMDAKAFLDNLRTHEYMSSGGHVGMAVGGFAPAIFPESKVANKAVRKALAPRPSKSLVAAGTAAPVVSRRTQPSLAPGSDNSTPVAPPAPRQHPSDAWASNVDDLGRPIAP